MIQLGAFLLPALPLLILLAALLLGRYPGCETIVRLSERVSRAAALTGRPRAAVAPSHRSSFAPTGGLLLAVSLSGRAPPG